MSVEPKPAFYESTPTPVMGKDSKPVIANLIKDPNVAHEIAKVEATQGVDAALKREGELRRQHVDGLTDWQRRNIEIMDGLSGDYPDAFAETTDSLGRRILLLETSGINFDYSDTIITQNGIAHINLDEAKSYGFENTDLTPVVSVLADRSLPHEARFNYIYTQVTEPKNGERRKALIYYREVDLGDDEALNSFRTALTEVQKINAERKVVRAKIDEKQTADSILSRLKQ